MGCQNPLQIALLAPAMGPIRSEQDWQSFMYSPSTGPPLHVLTLHWPVSDQSLDLRCYRGPNDASQELVEAHKVPDPMGYLTVQLPQAGGGADALWAVQWIHKPTSSVNAVCVG